jgi:hypothetical protein
MRLVLIASVLVATASCERRPLTPVNAWESIDPTFNGCAGG